VRGGTGSGWLCRPRAGPGRVRRGSWRPSRHGPMPGCAGRLRRRYSVALDFPTSSHPGLVPSNGSSSANTASISSSTRGRCPCSRRSSPKPWQFSHDFHHRLRLRQLAGETLIVGAELLVLLLRRGLALRSRRFGGQGVEPAGIAAPGPVDQVGVIQPFPSQQRTLRAGLGQPFVLLHHRQFVRRGERPALRLPRTRSPLLLIHRTVIGPQIGSTQRHSPKSPVLGLHIHRRLNSPRVSHESAREGVGCYTAA
jgi:hypothetical protein